jgi:hypothetical protein
MMCGLHALSAIELQDDRVRLRWEQGVEGWRLAQVDLGAGGVWLSAGQPSGEHTFLFAAEAPDRAPIAIAWEGSGGPFPEPNYRYNASVWRHVTTPVALNLAGQAKTFLPETALLGDDGSVRFRRETEEAAVESEWRLGPERPGEVRVSLTLTAKRAGYFSMATPTLATLAESDLAWAEVPGYFRGRSLNPDFVLAMAYGFGLPSRPMVLRERAAGTLAPHMTNRAGVTLAAVPEPGQSADPWAKDGGTRATWQLGLSHMNRGGELSPTLYFPVLGEVGSRLEAGESRSFHFRYLIGDEGWFETLKDVIYRIYRLEEALHLKQPEEPMSERLHRLHAYVVDEETSLWRTEEFEGATIGAQAYLGGVHGSDRDAMKNADYGAMWMLGRITEDQRVLETRLPAALSFKLAQQELSEGFFFGAARGQYFLSKSRRFTEEWGDYVEPVAVTYYVISDIGNILLFEPANAVLRERLRLGAERLLDWQSPDGSWQVAYDWETQRPLFRELPDYRPTFYGLLIAYRILGDERYLAGARRGADWLVENAVAEGRFLGVCGDNRFGPDFATAQVAQGLLELFELTGEERYRDAAIATARFYVTSIFTHPVASTEPKLALGQQRADWEISQMGLGFEHGGAIGSANGQGPILLASHAGMFVRFSELTGDPLFRDLARAAALARHAFVDPATGVASYYWRTMNRGAGPYPHHAWWQIGWITDYLLAEAETRSGGRISFPAGFMTPKVGPHRAFGFAPGDFFGRPVDLILRSGLVKADSPQIESIATIDRAGKALCLALLSMDPQSRAARISVDLSAIGQTQLRSVALRSADGTVIELDPRDREWKIEFNPYGLAALELLW